MSHYDDLHKSNPSRYDNNNRCYHVGESDDTSEYRSGDLRDKYGSNSKGQLFHSRSNSDLGSTPASAIFRYKFTDELTILLYEFAKIHEYDDRKTFKESWEIWVKENNEFINKEYERLNKMGYAGDILKKMFKSARYYYRKKGTEQKAPAERRAYVSVSREVLDAIDDHIIRCRIVNNNSVKPSNGFTEFCQMYCDMIEDEKRNLFTKGYESREDAINKIKKTYKNRYFLLTKTNK
jgi:hypothetical protein